MQLPFAIGLVLLIWGKSASGARLIGDQIPGQMRAQVPPKWPDTYEMEYTLSLPYLQTLQPGGLRYPVHIWWDGPNGKYRFDVYNGLDSQGYNTPLGTSWNLYPRITELACDFSNSTVGPTISGQQQQLMLQLGLGDGESSTPLPDISGWSYAGTAQVRNFEAYVWQLSVRNGDKTANYQFFTAHNGWPLRFHMMGRNILTGSHFDEYVVEFTRFKPGPVPQSAFELPELCKSARARAVSAEHMGGVAARLGTLLPAARVGAGPVSGLLNELRTRSETVWEANARLVEEHNRLAGRPAGAVAGGAANGAGPSYTLSLNHFAYMNHQQWAATMLGALPAKKERKSSAAGLSSSGSASTSSASNRLGSSAALGTYRRVLRDEELPASVDWRGTGADGPGVKDQVSCGSCWAFSAAGAMQGAWFNATGESLSFSEQQLVDCAWDYGNQGCAGGYIEPTLQYVVDAGGVVQTADYPYLAQNGYCKGPLAPTLRQPLAGAGASTPRHHSGSSSSSSGAGSVKKPESVARFSGYVNVAPRDEGALKEAVALFGPVSVLMNAARVPFKFYSEGVFFDAECGESPDFMDHAILLVGYGTTPEGVDYWLIKNSWSKYWGMDGYARVARKGNDCGITTDPVLAVVEGSALARHMASSD